MTLLPQFTDTSLESLNGRWIETKNGFTFKILTKPKWQEVDGHFRWVCLANIGVLAFISISLFPLESEK